MSDDRQGGPIDLHGLALVLAILFFAGWGLAVGHSWGSYAGHKRGYAQGYVDALRWNP